jgi:hypothetical protein
MTDITKSKSSTEHQKTGFGQRLKGAARSTRNSVNANCFVESLKLLGSTGPQIAGIRKAKAVHAAGYTVRKQAFWIAKAKSERICKTHYEIPDSTNLIYGSKQRLQTPIQNDPESARKSVVLD